MTADVAEKLDADELYHLALQASQSKDHDKAISYLKQSLSLKPSANTQYILAAEHAEIGMFERAIEEMDKALQMNSELWTAYFQKGLLFVTLNNPQAAIAAWQPLQQLPDNHYLRLFSNGLSAAFVEDIVKAISLLEAGFAENTDNPALNNDMKRILTNLKDVSSKAEGGIAAGSPLEEERPSNHVFLSAYKDNSKN